MNLQLQPLRHFSDFDGTSESEASEISIVLPYAPRIRSKKQQPPADGFVRRKRGSRALRRYENEAYLSSLVMITETDAEYEADDYWPDKAQEDTGFKCLFEDSSVRAVWDAFISLTERKQIEILGSLPYQRAGCFLGSEEEEEEEETADGSRPRRVDKNINNAAVSGSQRTRRPRCRPRRQHRGKPHVRLEDSLPDAEPLDSADVLDLLDASTVDPTALAGFHEGQHEQHQSMDSDVPTQEPAEGDYNSDTEVCRPPAVGSISPKLMAFIKTSARLMAADAGRGSKKRHFSVQDLCLIQRVEDELRTTFATATATGSQTAEGGRRWTPSTSLLLPLKEAATAADDVNRIGAGRPMVLNGFHRMLVHATAAYLGLVSYSAWNASFEDRQLWVDNRYATFVPVDLNFVSAIRQALLEQQSQLCHRH